MPIAPGHYRTIVDTYLGSLSPGSRRTMREALETIARLLTGGQCDASELDWAGLRLHQTAAIRSKLAEQYSAATANKMLSALRGVLKVAFQRGQISAEDYSLARNIEAIKGKSHPVGRVLSPGELVALFKACAADTSPAGARDSAIFALLRAGGLKRAEMCGLDRKDYWASAGTLAVRGKGNKKRTVYIKGGASNWLNDWLATRGDVPGPLFCPIQKGGKIRRDQRLTPQAIFNTLAKRAAQAGIQDVSPHDFRRTFIADLLDAGADISTVQELVGHASVNTTTRYEQRDEKAKQRASDLIHVPYWRR